MGLWEHVGERSDDCLHANLRYDEVRSSGPPSRPLEFPAPSVYSCKTVTLRARDHRSGTIHNLDNVILKWDPESGKLADTAYLAKKKLAKSIYGTVWCCVVLKRSYPDGHTQEGSSVDALTGGQWESTDLLAAIKTSEWSKIQRLRGRHLEDPIKEIAAMQHIGNYHPHVMGALEFLQDEKNLYVVMQHLPNGGLYERVLGEDSEEFHSTLSESSDKGSLASKEDQARVWFRQLLLAIFHLQKKGVCHRDISLENLLLDENDQLVLIDLGLSLRVPYNDPCNYGCVSDASAGTCRRLMKAQGQSGKLMYAAPEVIEGEGAFDGFATDLWSAGVVLFSMLTGMAPFRWAHKSDKQFSKISTGGFRELMNSLDVTLSDDACNLLQGLFWRDPSKRFNLADLMDHPWVVNQRVPEPIPVVPPKSRRFSLSSIHRISFPTTVHLRFTHRRKNSRCKPEVSQVPQITQIRGT